MQKAACYLRVSQPSQAKKDKISLEQQEIAVRNYCENQAWEVVEPVYRDAGKSGATIEKRTEMQRLLSDAEEGTFEFVVTWDITRFGRSVRDTTNSLHTLKQLNIPLIALDQGIDTRKDDKSSNLQLNILNSIAEYERETIRDRTQNTIVALLEKREIFVGHPPYGYFWNKETKKIELHPKEAPTVKFIIEQYLAGKSLWDISRMLIDRNAPCRHKRGSWHSGTIHNFFNNEAYLREVIWVKYGDNQYDFPCKKLITETEWRDIQQRLASGNTRAGRTALVNEDFLLHRKLLCPSGHKLLCRRGHPKKDGTQPRSYSCTWHEQPASHRRSNPKCDFVRIDAETVEQHVMSALCAVIRGERLQNIQDSQQDIKVDELTAKIEYATRILAKRKAALAALEAAFNEGDYPAKMYFEKKVELTNAINSLQGEHDMAYAEQNSIRSIRTELQNYQKFSMKHIKALIYLTDKLRHAPFHLRRKLIHGFLDGRAVIPLDHDFAKMQIPWRYNLTVLREVLAELDPEPDPKSWGVRIGGKEYPPEGLQEIWDDLLGNEEDVTNQIVTDNLNSCRSEGPHRSCRLCVQNE